MTKKVRVSVYVGAWFDREADTPEKAAGLVMEIIKSRLWPKDFPKYTFDVILEDTMKVFNGTWFSYESKYFKVEKISGGAKSSLGEVIA